MNKTDLNALSYKQMNDIDDRRERIERAASTGRHEPSSAFGGLYDVEEVDDGGRLIERRERGVVDAFVPVAELPDSLRQSLEAGEDELPNAPLDMAAKPFARLPHEMQIVAMRSRHADRPLVLRRRAG